MSKRTINFSYNNLSPRSVKYNASQVTETQKGPIKINNLIDTMHNPQFEHIQLGFKEEQKSMDNQPYKHGERANGQTFANENSINQPQKQAQNGIKAENTPIDCEQILSKQNKPNHIRLLEFPAVIRDPIEADFQLDLITPKKVPNNANHSKQGVEMHQIAQEQINPQRQQEKLPNSSQKPKYTFAIVPPPPEEKSSIFCNIFGWCDKPKQRTYPIKD